MNFSTAIRTCFAKYATFSGRAARSEYWYFVLFNILCQIGLGILDSLLFDTGSMTTGPGRMAFESDGGPLAALFSLAVLLPSLAVGARRLHDIDKSGWWLLLILLPLVGFLVLLYFFVQPSQPEANRFGLRPGAGGPRPPGGGTGSSPAEPWHTSSVPKVPRS